MVDLNNWDETGDWDSLLQEGPSEIFEGLLDSSSLVKDQIVELLSQNPENQIHQVPVDSQKQAESTHHTLSTDLKLKNETNIPMEEASSDSFNTFFEDLQALKLFITANISPASLNQFDSLLQRILHHASSLSLQKHSNSICGNCQEFQQEKDVALKSLKLLQSDCSLFADNFVTLSDETKKLEQENLTLRESLQKKSKQSNTSNTTDDTHSSIQQQRIANLEQEKNAALEKMSLLEEELSQLKSALADKENAPSPPLLSSSAVEIPFASYDIHAELEDSRNLIQSLKQELLSMQNSHIELKKSQSREVQMKDALIENLNLLVNELRGTEESLRETFDCQHADLVHENEELQKQVFYLAAKTEVEADKVQLLTQQMEALQLPKHSIAVGITAQVEVTNVQQQTQEEEEEESRASFRENAAQTEKEEEEEVVEDNAKQEEELYLHNVIFNLQEKLFAAEQERHTLKKHLLDYQDLQSIHALLQNEIESLQNALLQADHKLQSVENENKAEAEKQTHYNEEQQKRLQNEVVEWTSKCNQCLAELQQLSCQVDELKQQLDASSQEKCILSEQLETVSRECVESQQINLSHVNRIQALEEQMQQLQQEVVSEQMKVDQCNAAKLQEQQCQLLEERVEEVQFQNEQLHASLQSAASALSTLLTASLNSTDNFNSTPPQSIMPLISQLKTQLTFYKSELEEEYSASDELKKKLEQQVEKVTDLLEQKNLWMTERDSLMGQLQQCQAELKESIAQLHQVTPPPPAAVPPSPDKSSESSSALQEKVGKLMKRVKILQVQLHASQDKASHASTNLTHVLQHFVQFASSVMNVNLVLPTEQDNNDLVQWMQDSLVFLEKAFQTNASSLLRVEEEAMQTTGIAPPTPNSHIDSTTHLREIISQLAQEQQSFHHYSNLFTQAREAVNALLLNTSTTHQDCIAQIVDELITLLLTHITAASSPPSPPPNTAPTQLSEKSDNLAEENNWDDAELDLTDVTLPPELCSQHTVTVDTASFTPMQPPPPSPPPSSQQQEEKIVKLEEEAHSLRLQCQQMHDLNARHLIHLADKEACISQLENDIKEANIKVKSVSALVEELESLKCPPAAVVEGTAVDVRERVDFCGGTDPFTTVLSRSADYKNLRRDMKKVYLAHKAVEEKNQSLSSQKEYLERGIGEIFALLSQWGEFVSSPHPSTAAATGETPTVEATLELGKKLKYMLDTERQQFTYDYEDLKTDLKDCHTRLLQLEDELKWKSTVNSTQEEALQIEIDELNKKLDATLASMGQLEQARVEAVHKKEEALRILNLLQTDLVSAEEERERLLAVIREKDMLVQNLERDGMNSHLRLSALTASLESKEDELLVIREQADAAEELKMELALERANMESMRCQLHDATHELQSAQLHLSIIKQQQRRLVDSSCDPMPVPPKVDNGSSTEPLEDVVYGSRAFRKLKKEITLLSGKLTASENNFFEIDRKYHQQEVIFHNVMEVLQKFWRFDCDTEQIPTWLQSVLHKEEKNRNALQMELEALQKECQTQVETIQDLESALQSQEDFLNEKHDTVNGQQQEISRLLRLADERNILLQELHARHPRREIRVSPVSVILLREEINQLEEEKWNLCSELSFFKERATSLEHQLDQWKRSDHLMLKLNEFEKVLSEKATGHSGTQSPSSRRTSFSNSIAHHHQQHLHQHSSPSQAMSHEHKMLQEQMHYLKKQLESHIMNRFELDNVKEELQQKAQELNLAVDKIAELEAVLKRRPRMVHKSTVVETHLWTQAVGSECDFISDEFRAVSQKNAELKEKLSALKDVNCHLDEEKRLRAICAQELHQYNEVLTVERQKQHHLQSALDTMEGKLEEAYAELRAMQSTVEQLNCDRQYLTEQQLLKEKLINELQCTRKGLEEDLLLAKKQACAPPVIPKSHRSVQVSMENVGALNYELNCLREECQFSVTHLRQELQEACLNIIQLENTVKWYKEMLPDVLPTGTEPTLVHSLSQTGPFKCLHCEFDVDSMCESLTTTTIVATGNEGQAFVPSNLLEPIIAEVGSIWSEAVISTESVGINTEEQDNPWEGKYAKALKRIKKLEDNTRCLQTEKNDLWNKCTQRDNEISQLHEQIENLEHEFTVATFAREEAEMALSSYQYQPNDTATVKLEETALPTPSAPGIAEFLLELQNLIQEFQMLPICRNVPPCPPGDGSNNVLDLLHYFSTSLQAVNHDCLNQFRAKDHLLASEMEKCELFLKESLHNLKTTLDHTYQTTFRQVAHLLPAAEAEEEEQCISADSVCEALLQLSQLCDNYQDQCHAYEEEILACRKLVSDVCGDGNDNCNATTTTSSSLPLLASIHHLIAMKDASTTAQCQAAQIELMKAKEIIQLLEKVICLLGQACSTTGEDNHHPMMDDDDDDVSATIEKLCAEANENHKQALASDLWDTVRLITHCIRAHSLLWGEKTNLLGEMHQLVVERQHCQNQMETMTQSQCLLQQQMEALASERSYLLQQMDQYVKQIQEMEMELARMRQQLISGVGGGGGGGGPSLSHSPSPLSFMPPAPSLADSRKDSCSPSLTSEQLSSSQHLLGGSAVSTCTQEIGSILEHSLQLIRRLEDRLSLSNESLQMNASKGVIWQEELTAILPLLHEANRVLENAEKEKKAYMTKYKKVLINLQKSKAKIAQLTKVRAPNDSSSICTQTDHCTEENASAIAAAAMAESTAADKAELEQLRLDFSDLEETVLTLKAENQELEENVRSADSATAQLQSNCQCVEQQLDAAKKESAHLLELTSMLQCQVDELQQQIQTEKLFLQENYHNQIGTFENEINSLKSIKEQLEMELANHERQKEDFLRQIADVHATVGVLENEKEELQQTVNETKQQLQIQEDTLLQTKAELDFHLSALQQMQDKYRDVELSNQELQNSYNKIQDELTEMCQQQVAIEEIKHKMENLHSENQTFRQQLNNCECEILREQLQTATEQAADQAEAQLVELVRQKEQEAQAALLSKEAIIQSLEQAMRQLNDDLQTSQQIADELQIKLDAHSSKQPRETRDFSQQQTDDVLENELNRLLQLNAELDAESIHWKTLFDEQLHQSQTDETLHQELENASTYIRSMESEYNQLRVDHDLLIEELEIAKEAFEKLQNENDFLNQKLQQETATSQESGDAAVIINLQQQVNRLQSTLDNIVIERNRIQQELNRLVRAKSEADAVIARMSQEREFMSEDRELSSRHTMHNASLHHPPPDLKHDATLKESIVQLEEEIEQWKLQNNILQTKCKKMEFNITSLKKKHDNLVLKLEDKDRELDESVDHIRRKLAIQERERTKWLREVSLLKNQLQEKAEKIRILEQHARNVITSDDLAHIYLREVVQLREEVERLSVDNENIRKVKDDELKSVQGSIEELKSDNRQLQSKLRSVGSGGGAEDTKSCANCLQLTQMVQVLEEELQSFQERGNAYMGDWDFTSFADEELCTS